MNYKKELLLKHIGKLAFTFHPGNSEIKNTRTETRISKETIAKISKRKETYIDTPNNGSFERLW